MQPDLATSIRQISYGGEPVRQQLKRMISNLINPHHTIQRLFYGDDGKLKREAVEWTAKLASENFVDRSAFDPDPRIHARNEGRRELALEIISSLRLDTAKLAALNRELREHEHD